MRESFFSNIYIRYNQALKMVQIILKEFIELLQSCGTLQYAFRLYNLARDIEFQ